MKTKRAYSSTSAPIFRFRSMLLGISLLAVLISGPLLLVWKQVCINSLSLKMEYTNDTLAMCNKKIDSLRLKCEYLSSNERIERIARSSLGLDYPTPEQIVIVRVGERRGFTAAGWTQGVLAFLRKSLFGESG
ncbi:MAG: cell division protein FtsL [Chitinispirillaceae bacterium]|nr:cell division protein FtsL [Chitinispirillaceae bacterium]